MMLNKILLLVDQKTDIQINGYSQKWHGVAFCEILIQQYYCGCFWIAVTLGRFIPYFRTVNFNMIEPSEYITPPPAQRSNTIEMEEAEIAEPLATWADGPSNELAEELPQIMPKSHDEEVVDCHFKETTDEPYEAHLSEQVNTPTSSGDRAFQQKRSLVQQKLVMSNSKGERTFHQRKNDMAEKKLTTE